MLNQVDDQRAPRTNATVDQLIAEYFKYTDIEPTTMKGWKSKLKIHISPLLGNTSISRVDTHMIEKFYAELRRCRKHCDKRPMIDHRTVRPHDCDHRCRRHKCAGLSTSMIREIHTILHGAFNRAVVWTWRGTNPVDHAIAPPAPKTKPRPPSPQDAARLLDAAWQHPSWGTYVWLA